MSAPIALIGELALHCFVPRTGNVRSVAPEAPVQLGGGAGMAARHLHARGTPFSALTFSGDDALGLVLGSWLAPLSAEAWHVCDRGSTSSVVYLEHGNHLESLRVVTGSARATAVLSRLDRLAKDAIVYCPYFIGYEAVVRELGSLPVRTILDFGHFANVGDLELTVELLHRAPAPWVAQFSAEAIPARDRPRLLRAARSHGCLHAFVTAADQPVLAFDEDGEFETSPHPVTPVCAIGAGDVFVAELAAGLAEGGAFRESLACAARAAGSKCLRWGVAAAGESS